MPKLKTHKGAQKRFKMTASGKIARKRAFHSHILTKKAQSRKRKLRKATLVSKADHKHVQLMIG